MPFRYRLFAVLFAVLQVAAPPCLAAGGTAHGVIHFTGKVVEPTCQIPSDPSVNPAFNTCARHVAAGITVTTRDVAPAAHLLAWRDGASVKDDLPVRHWKVTELVYR